MIVTIHQPEHLPWPGFFDKMRQADVFVLLDTTQFVKDDFQNRNRIKTRNGPTWLTVPVYKKGKSTQLIIDTEISNERNWRQRCWSLIQQNYKDAPYFAAYSEAFGDLYRQSWAKLADFNIAAIRLLVDQLGLETELRLASELGIYERGGTNVNLAICRELNAKTYLSGSHGKHYLDQDAFAAQGIAIQYQEFQHPVYPQLWGEFASHMSTLDLLFNCGDQSMAIVDAANGRSVRDRTHGLAENAQMDN